MTYDTVAAVSQVTSLFLFLAMFLVVIGYVFWPKNLEKFDTAARAALDLDKDKAITRGKK
jgi:cbb3-type cytochrome oxidase subunit 3